MKKTFVIIFSFIVLMIILSSFMGGPHKETLRSTVSGEVIGQIEDGNYVWRGIPFAKPPVGDLRWKAPVKPDNWEGVLEATELSQACFQPDGIVLFGSDGGSKWSGSEDCLYLNIWSPKKSEEKKLPVMMWIHGGANRMGSSAEYNPQAIVSKQDVIVVVVQYRMSTLGWFRHPSLKNTTTTEEDNSGNYGTLDNIMALRWIKDNISVFGGDPDNVTIFGESAGGHNVAALYASPLAEGLFHKAISQSGIASTASALQAESYYPESRISGTVSSKEMVNILLMDDKKAGSSEEAKSLQDSMSDEELRSYLRSKEASEILVAETKASPKLGGMTRAYNDGHVIRLDGIEAIFSDSKINRVPIILGTNRYETKLFNMWNPKLIRMGEDTKGFLPWVVSWVLPTLPQEIYKPDYYDAVNQYGSDSWKESAADTPATQLVNSGHEKTFVYRFDWQDLPEFNGVDLGRIAGASHALEIPFVFGSLFDSFIIKIIFKRESLNSAKELSNHMISYWTQFAYTGDPAQGRDGNSPKWESWSEDSTYIILDSDRGKGISMTDKFVSFKSLVKELSEDSRLNKKEKCEILYNGSNTDDGYPWAAFNEFEEGHCLTLDLSYLDRSRREQIEEEIQEGEEK
ncbi:MAG: carboxylesterase/lipase family protein [Gammaproteobacteria bacterium]